MLFKKMWKDMLLNKAQFISILLMSMIGVFIYSGITSEWKGLEKTLDEYYQSTNFADVWIYKTEVSKEDEEKIQSIEGVKDTQRRLFVNGYLNIDGSPNVDVIVIDQEKISKNLYLSGEEFSNDRKGVWVDDLFAQENNLKIGDSVEILVNGYTIQQEIIGTVINPEYIYETGEDEALPNHKNYGFIYMSSKSLDNILPDYYNQLVIVLEDENQDVQSEIDKVLNYSVYLTRNEQESYVSFTEEIKQHRAFGFVFPIAFLVIVLLTILTTMTRIVNTQRTEIGILKALGFKNSRIILHYISYGLFPTLIGSLIGVILGPMLLPYLFYQQLEGVYVLPEWKAITTYQLYIMAGMCVVSSLLVSYLACKNHLREVPATCLRKKAPNIGRKYNKKNKESKIIKYLPFSLQWNLRDISRNKLRSLMGIIGSLGCTAILVCAFGLKDMMNDIVDWQYYQIYQFSNKIIVNEDISDQELSQLVVENNGQLLQELTVEIKSNSNKKTASIQVLEDNTYIKMYDKNRNEISLPNEGISISYKMATLLNVKIGDQIEWHLYGEEGWITSTITAIHRSPLTQGIIIAKDEYTQENQEFKATSIVTNQKVIQENDNIDKVSSIDDLVENYESFSTAIDTMVYILLVAAIILAVVALYNLGVLSYVERYYELATLKVIGFEYQKIRGIFFVQTFILSIIAIIPGVYVGQWLLEYTLEFVGDSLDFIVELSAITIVLSLIITLGVGIIVNLFLSKKLKTIDMVSALKDAE